MIFSFALLTRIGSPNRAWLHYR